MADLILTQVLENGPRNYVVRAYGILDTANVPVTDLIDTTAAAFINPGNRGNSPPPFTVALKEVSHNVDLPLEFNLFWDATADVMIATFVGARPCVEFDPPIPNNAGAGKTGKVQYSVTGFAAGSNAYDVTMRFIKKFS